MLKNKIKALCTEIESECNGNSKVTDCSNYRPVATVLVAFEVTAVFILNQIQSNPVISIALIFVIESQIPRQIIQNSNLKLIK